MVKALAKVLGFTMTFFVLSSVVLVHANSPHHSPSHNNHQEALPDEKIIRVLAMASPYLLSDKKHQQGNYNRLITELSKDISVTFEITYFPPAIAEKNFLRKRFDCVFPTNTQRMPAELDLIGSAAFNMATAYVFTPLHQAKIGSYDQLTNKVISKRRGYSYGSPFIDPSTVIVNVKDLKQSLGMLAKGRTDAFIAYEPDATEIIKRYDIIKVHKDDAFVIHQQEEQISCYNTPQNIRFIEQFNQALLKLRENGKLTQLLNKKPNKK